MEKTIVTTGKTIDLAIEAALSQLGLDRDSVSVQVLQQAKPGFLGLGAQPAKVEVTYEAPDPAPKVALSSASRSKPKAKPVVEKKVEEKKVEAPKAEPKKEEKKPEPKKEAPKAPAEPKVYAPAEPGSIEEKIEVFLKGLLEHMGSDAVPHAWKVDANIWAISSVAVAIRWMRCSILPIIASAEMWRDISASMWMLRTTARSGRTACAATPARRRSRC